MPQGSFIEEMDNCGLTIDLRWDPVTNVTTVTAIVRNRHGNVLSAKSVAAVGSWTDVDMVSMLADVYTAWSWGRADSATSTLNDWAQALARES